jgi:recombinational DNA repair protein RecR
MVLRKGMYGLIMENARLKKRIDVLTDHLLELRFETISCFSCSHSAVDEVCDGCIEYRKWEPGEVYTGYRGKI